MQYLFAAGICDGKPDQKNVNDTNTPGNKKTVLQYVNHDMENIVTPINVEMYSQLLNESGYDKIKAQKLVNGFRNGFSIGYQGSEDVKRYSPNLKIRIGDEIDLWNKVMKEVKLNRYAGPFEEIPFDNFIQSPIGLVPKDDGHDTHLIFHLSYPRNGKCESLNANTPEYLCKVKYPDFNVAIQRCMEEGKFCHLGRSDVRSAFRNLGILRKHWKFLCMKAKNPLDGKTYYFFDKCLPFGSSVSCKIFQDSVAWIVQWRLKTKKKVTNYLDDFLFVALCKLMCNMKIQVFLDTCKLINLPVSMEKTFWASTQMTFLGFLIDTVRQLVCVPAGKITKGLNMILHVLSKKKVTILQIQKICGFLNFLGRCIVPGRAFTR